jgi:hypothetical protein
MFVEGKKLWPSTASYIACLAYRLMWLTRWRVAGDAAVRHLLDHKVVTRAGATITVPVLENILHTFTPRLEYALEGEYLETSEAEVLNESYTVVKVVV